MIATETKAGRNQLSGEKFALTDKRKLLETTSKGTKKLGLTNFKEEALLCRANEKN